MLNKNTLSLQKGFLFRLLFCILCIAYFQYLYLQKQNELTKIKLEIPKVSAELKKIKEENIRLQFEIDRFEDPYHLSQIARSEEFSHLKHPLLSEILTLRDESEIIPVPEKEKNEYLQKRQKSPLFVGAK